MPAQVEQVEERKAHAIAAVQSEARAVMEEVRRLGEEEGARLGAVETETARRESSQLMEELVTFQTHTTRWRGELQKADKEV